MPTLDLAVKDFASPTLAAELASEVADDLAHADPDHPMSVDDVDAIEILAAQAAGIAALHKLSGRGHVEIAQSELGWQVQLFTVDNEHAHAQALDSSAMAARAAARKAKADAAAKALARAKVTRTAIGPATRKPGAGGTLGVVKPAAPLPPATRPTTPPPRRA